MPLGPQTQSCLGARDPFQRAQRLLGGLGDRRGVAASQASKVLPAGSPDWRRRIGDRRRSRPAASSASRTRSDLGGLPALRGRGREHVRRGPADVGHPQPPQQPRRARSGSGGGGRGLDGHAPKPSQERVERCSELLLDARAGNAITCVPPRWARIAARSPSPNGRRRLPRRAPRRPPRAPCSLASATASASLRRNRVAPGRGRGDQPPLGARARSQGTPAPRCWRPAGGAPARRPAAAGSAPRGCSAAPAWSGRGGRPRAARPARRRARRPARRRRRAPRRARRRASTGPSRARRRPRSSTASDDLARLAEADRVRERRAAGAAARAPRPASPPAPAA